MHMVVVPSTPSGNMEDFVRPCDDFRRLTNFTGVIDKPTFDSSGYKNVADCCFFVKYERPDKGPVSFEIKKSFWDRIDTSWGPS